MEFFKAVNDTHFETWKPVNAFNIVIFYIRLYLEMFICNQCHAERHGSHMDRYEKSGQMRGPKKGWRFGLHSSVRGSRRE